MGFSPSCWLLVTTNCWWFGVRMIGWMQFKNASLHIAMTVTVVLAVPLQLFWFRSSNIQCPSVMACKNCPWFFANSVGNLSSLNCAVRCHGWWQFAKNDDHVCHSTSEICTSSPHENPAQASSVCCSALVGQSQVAAFLLTFVPPQAVKPHCVVTRSMNSLKQQATNIFSIKQPFCHHNWKETAKTGKSQICQTHAPQLFLSKQTKPAVVTSLSSKNSFPLPQHHWHLAPQWTHDFARSEPCENWPGSAESNSFAMSSLCHLNSSHLHHVALCATFVMLCNPQTSFTDWLACVIAASPHELTRRKWTVNSCLTKNNSTKTFFDGDAVLPDFARSNDSKSIMTQMQQQDNIKETFRGWWCKLLHYGEHDKHRKIVVGLKTRQLTGQDLLVLLDLILFVVSFLVWGFRARFSVRCSSKCTPNWQRLTAARSRQDGAHAWYQHRSKEISFYNRKIFYPPKQLILVPWSTTSN